LRPLKRRFPADKALGKRMNSVSSKSGAEVAAVQTLRDLRMLSSRFDFEIVTRPFSEIDLSFKSPHVVSYGSNLEIKNPALVAERG
jgi:hypothetical protein